MTNKIQFKGNRVIIDRADLADLVLLDDSKTVELRATLANALTDPLIIETLNDGYWLTRRWGSQDIEDWEAQDMQKIVAAFPEEWLIERAVFRSEAYLTVSNDGKINRPWTPAEVIKVKKILEG